MKSKTGQKDFSEIYRDAFENTGTAMVVLEEDGTVLLVNQAFERLSGFKREEVEGKKRWEDFVAQEDLERMREYRRLRMKDPRLAPRKYEFHFVDRSGEERPVLATVERIPGTERIVASLLDVTPFKELQAALEESETRYWALVEASRDAILLLDPQRHIITCNAAFEELFGWRRDELVGQSVRIIHPSEESFREMGERAYLDIERYGFFRTEWTLKRRDGSLIPVETVTSALRRPDGTPAGYVAVIRDISERRRLQEQAERVQRLEALGQLAGGIAHDFGNVLTSIGGFVEMALKKLPEGDPLRKFLEPIRQSAQGAVGLIRKLLFFGRQQPIQRVPLDLNQSIEEAVEVLSRLLGEDISLELQLEPKLWAVEGDPSAIRQVITNLLVNARDAMPEGGKITIKTENVHVDERRSKEQREARPGDFVRLSVEDTGVGMEKEVMDRIFEPFFTTKEAGRGTGLGLSVVYGIVKEHGGWIDVESTPGRGSIFTVYFPSRGTTVHEGEEGGPSEESKGRGERVLVVEDEEGVRRFTAVALQERGYEVVEASRGEEALELFDREGGEFDLLFTDVVLPDLSGVEVARRLLERKPELKVILTSGYVGEKARWQEIKEKGFRLLHKPYSLSDLLRTVREALKKT